MRIRKVVLIEARAAGRHIFWIARKIPRLGLPILGAISKRKGLQVKIFVEEIAPINLAAIKEADFIGISCLTPTSLRAYELIKRIKEFKPEIPVVIGGPHVTFLPEEALNEGADFVVRGEGEETIGELIDFLNQSHFPKELPEEIPGLAFKKDGEIFHTPERTLITNLDELPFPDFTLIEGWQRMSNISVQTSRGCPHNCKFCSVVKMFGRGYRFRSPLSVIEELKRLKEKNLLRRKNHLFFCDDNFADNPKRTIELLEAMARAGFKHPCSTQVSVRVAKYPEILKLLRRVGFRKLFLGFESINPAILKAYRKNQTVEDIILAIETLHKYGFWIHGMFIVDTDYDWLESIKKTLQFALKYMIDSVQLLFLTPAPGTETYEELEAQDRLLTKDWRFFDGHHLVTLPRLMKPWEMQRAVNEAMDRLCSFFEVIRSSLHGKFTRAAFPWYGMWLLPRWKRENQEFFNWLKREHFQKV